MEKVLLCYLDLEKNILENLESLKKIKPDILLSFIIFSLRYTVITSKHPIFKEEAEWRLVYDRTATPSEIVDERVIVINGVPQKVAVSPLVNIPNKGVIGIEPLEAIEKILIGPSEFPEVIKSAFVTKLVQLGMKQNVAEEKVELTNIPLRNS
jgi:hypothetical protein